jgi:hypothetical protein
MASVPMANELHAQPAARRCAIVFDFDDTLAVGCGHAASRAIPLFGGAERLALLTALCTELRAAGVLLTVCSYNERAVIEPLLRQAGLLGFFEQHLLFGGSTFEQGGPLASLGWSANKGHVITRLIAPAVLPSDAGSDERLLAELAPPSLVSAAFSVPEVGRVAPSNDGTSSILFVDDMAENIMDVRAACASCATLLVPEYTAMRPADVAAIRAWAQPPAAPPAAGAEFAVFDAPTPVPSVTQVAAGVV